MSSHPKNLEKEEKTSPKQAEGRKEQIINEIWNRKQ